MDFFGFWLTQNPGSVSAPVGEVPLFDRSGCRKYPNQAERKAYRRVIVAERDLSRRTFMLTIFYTGCRISEALNLLAGRIDGTASAVVLETLKRRKRGCYRAVPVPETLTRTLLEVAAGKSLGTKVWSFSRSTAYRMIKAKMKEAEIVGGMAMPKGLRHGFAVACLSVKIPLTLIQKWMGHARLDTTAIYLDLLGEEEREMAKRLWSD
ncbi:MAG: site-specific integrase [Chthoniobacter sp.]|nr:site-specific integrase [Chthoniobacter sp.]